MLPQRQSGLRQPPIARQRGAGARTRRCVYTLSHAIGWKDLMHDLIIKNGTIIDGTGREKFAGDIAVDGERIVEVGEVNGAARREIDAKGMLVAPGWVDIHTHYDGQASWDPLLAPSSWHGVTTAVMGNC